MEFNSLDELEKYLNDLIEVALETNVKQTAEETMKMHIQKDVYTPYTPMSYERTGKLLQDVEAKMIDSNTLSLEDTRNEEPDVENGRDVIKTIEKGKGYQWGYTRNLDEVIGARPFVQNTYDELASGSARESLKQGLKRQGLNVE
jgi:phage gpG-like protein